MAIKAQVLDLLIGGTGDPGTQFQAQLIDTSSNQILSAWGDVLLYGTDLTTYSPLELMTAIQAKVIAFAANISITIGAGDIVFLSSPFSATQANSLAGSASKSFNSVSRTLNSAFQISSSRDTFVSYAVDVSSTLSLITGQAGTVVLEYADNSGMSTNVVTVNSAVNGNTGSLAIGLNLTQTVTTVVSGVIPAGKYVRIRTVNTTGTPTFTYKSGQEVLS